MTADDHDEEHCCGAVMQEVVVTQPGDPMQITGFRCGACDFQTVTVETYIPTEKPCPDCGGLFLGMPDVEEEPCGECFGQRIDAWLLAERKEAE